MDYVTVARKDKWLHVIWLEHDQNLVRILPQVTEDKID